MFWGGLDRRMGCLFAMAPGGPAVSKFYVYFPICTPGCLFDPECIYFPIFFNFLIFRMHLPFSHFPFFRFFLLPFFTSIIAISPISSPKSSSPSDSHSLCSDRCNRLLRRSFDRLDHSLGVDEVLYKIGSFRKAQLLNGRSQDSSEELALPAAEFKDICWKFFDFEDCQKQCQKVFKGRRKRRKRKGANGQQEKGMAVVEPENRLVLHFCHRADFGVPLEHFACLHKFHSFLEVHCSTYQQRAVQLRLIGLQLDQNGIDAREFGGKRELERLKKAIDQELCLLLHQHSSCLVNSGARFCPQLRSAQPQILSRSTLREHFLSLLLPFGQAIDQKEGQIVGQGDYSSQPVELDQLFPDLLFDHCQLFDFHKMAKEWMERMQNEGERAQREFEPSEGEEGGQMGEEQRSTTKRAVWPKTFGQGESSSNEDGDLEVTVAPSNRRVFSSEEDLEDTPPNFFYSTARLPKDFYTRYAIWWGSRGAGKGGSGEKRKSLENSQEELTAVQLLLPTAASPSMPPRAHSQLTLNSNRPIANLEHQKRTTISNWVQQIGETQPDSPLSTPMPPRIWEGNVEVGWTQTLPYLVNGRATTPVERWAGEVTTTEIQLMDGTRRRVWTANAEEEAEWRRREAKEREGRPSEKEETKRKKIEKGKGPIEEYEEEWAYEDDFESSQFEEEGEEGNVRMLKPAGEMTNGKGPSNGGTTPLHGRGQEPEGNVRLLPFQTTEEPMFRETNIYFAKILEFGQEPEADAEWMQRREDTSSPKTIAQMVHFPGDQLPPIRKKEMPKSAELEAGEWRGKGNHPRQQQQNPYEILAADPNQFMVGPKTTTPINWKTGAPFDSSTPNSDRPKIFVSAEPVPAKKSETLLVLLGIYLTFFAVASFFLFCLVLTCLERNRRHASLRRQSAKMSTGSAILYIDEKDGTLKDVV